MSFNRPNLNYEIRPKAGRHNDILKDIVEYIKSKHSGECGIVYVGGRDKVEETACTLDEVYGISTQAYHAGLTSSMKEKIQRDWQSGKVKVIVATVSDHLTLVLCRSDNDQSVRLHLVWVSTRKTVLRFAIIFT